MNHSQLMKKYFELLKRIKELEKKIEYLDRIKENKPERTKEDKGEPDKDE